MTIGVMAAQGRMGRWLPRIASIVVAALVGQMLTPVAAQADPSTNAPAAPAAPSRGHPVHGRTVNALPRKSAPLNNGNTVPAAAVWPKSGTVDVTVPATDAGLARAGGLPVWVGASQRQQLRTGQAPAAAAGRVRVRVLDRDATRRAGVDGLLLTVARSDGASTAGRAKVRIDYSGFAQAFGGSFGTRLRLEQLPTCATTVPERADCRVGKPLPAVNDGVAKTLTSEVEAVGSGETVLAATATSSGSSGDFKATSLSPSAAWQVGMNTGSFNWTYPMRVPPVPGGLVPQVELSYSSSSVDGRTSNSNGQPSWVGEGFDLWPGYIERSYKSCSDDGAPKNNGIDSGDQCWAYDNATITWGGRGGELVLANASTDTWRLKDDDGTRFEKLTGAGNGDNDGEYWKVTATDGTQYFFGCNHVPACGSGTPETSSAWTVPVFGNNSGEPCYKSSGFADSSCQQAWRWNLDYVVDPQQNAITYYYKTETNKYAKYVSLTNDVSYDRGGYLDHIDYGLRSTNLSAKAPAQVAFGVSERCVRATESDCDSGNIASHPDYWWDVPWDLNCTSNCALAGKISPTFWSRKRLTSVTTRVLKSDGVTYKDVESWGLTQDWGLADIDRDLLLTEISHTGDPKGAPVSLPKVTFNYGNGAMANRVDKLYDDIPPFIRYRLGAVNDEYGGIVDVNYSGEDCAPGDVPTPETNTRRCFPVYWQPAGHDSPIRDWFHKYVVTQLVRTDRTGGAPDMVTNYSYLGGGAWHFDDDDGLTKDKYKTWSQWRGFGKVVETSGGLNDMRSQTDHFFFRGMDGDRLNTSGGAKSIKISDGESDTTEGSPFPDHDSLQGMEYRSVTYDRPGGSVVGKAVNAPWHSQTASRTRSWGTVTANLVDVRVTRTFRALSSGGWRETKKTTEHDTTTGLPTRVEDLGDVANATDDQCTTTSYARNTSAWLMDFPSQVRTVALSCDKAPTDLSTQLISDERSYYDNGAVGAPPSRGEVTKHEEAASAVGTTVTYVADSQTSYDSYGRVKTSTDAGGNTTTTTYTDTSGMNTGVSVDSPKVLIGGTPTPLTTSQVIDPSFGLPTSETDEGGKTTSLTYDGLGHLTAVRLPNRPTGTPNLEYTYRVVDGQPVAVGTKSLTAGGGQSTSYVLYDGLLRSRQTQEDGPDGGRLIADTFYDVQGKVARTYDTYYALGAPSTSLFGVSQPGDVETQNAYEYDGLGRVTVDRLLAGSSDGIAEKWRTTTSYGGDRVTVDPPAGGTPTTTITDARDNTVELRQYQGDAPTGAYDSTTYAYTPAGDLKTIKGPGGLTWSYGYDLRGRKIQDSDPDKGLTTTTYDDLDQVRLVKDAREKALAFTYDATGRKTAEFDTSETGPKLAEWTYDTARKGQPTSAIRYSGGVAYTTSYSLYDNLNRPGKTTYTIPSVDGEQALAGTYDFGITYNLDDTVQTVGYPAGGGLAAEKVTTKYDADDLQRPVQLTSDLSSTTYVADTNYSFDGKPQQYTLSGGGKPVYLTYNYENGTQRLKESRTERQDIAGVDRDAFYSYDDAGNVTQVKDVSRAGTDNQCFRYDYLSRLTQAWAQGTGTCATDPTTALGGPAPYWQSFTYDAAGNRKTETQHNTGGTVSATRTYTYGTGHQLATVDQTGSGAHTESYFYDAAGNTNSRTIGSTGQTLTWDLEGELAKVSDGGTGDTSFVYDADGDRLLRRDGGGTTLYLDNMELRLSKATGGVTGSRYYEHNGQTIAVRTPAGLQLLATDNHGTAEEAINATTQAMTLRRFTPFGQARGTAAGSWPDEKGFVGGTIDATTGLTHLGAREYDPNTGRFISVDPLIDQNDPQQLNAYAYANNSPMTLSDPDGQRPVGDNIHDEWSYNDYKRTGHGSRPGAHYDYSYCGACRETPEHGPARYSSHDPIVHGRNWRVDTSGAGRYHYIPPPKPCTGWCKVTRNVKKWGSNAGHFAWQHKWDIASTAVIFVPGVGELAWAYRGYQAYRAVRVASAGGRIGSWAFRARGIGARSKLFGDIYAGASRPGWLNRGGRLAIGWSAMGTRHLGFKAARAVFRVKIGRPHFDLLFGPWR
jgi:RHS repeat-associated protein